MYHNSGKFVLMASVGSSVVMIAAAFAPGQEPVDATEAKETVAYLLCLRHGLAERMMGAETKALLHKVIDDPEPYLDAIAGFMRVDDGGVLASRLILNQCMGALILAKRIGPEHARPMVRELFHEVSEATARYPDLWTKTLDEEPDLQRIRTLFRVRNLALDVMAEFRDPHAVDEVMKTVEKQDGGTRIWMLRYLEKVGPLRPDIKPQLEKMLTSKTSPLRNHPILVRAVAAIHKAEDKKADGDRDHPADDPDDH